MQTSSGFKQKGKKNNVSSRPDQDARVSFGLKKDASVPMFLKRSVTPHIQSKFEEDVQVRRKVLDPAEEEVLEKTGTPQIQRQGDEEVDDDMEVVPKLEVGSPGDAYEQEADQVADQVMRMPDTKDSAFQVKEDDPESESVPSIQAKSSGSPALSGKAAQTAQTPGVGSPLPVSVRSRVEPVLGNDLSHVRVHDDARSSEAAQSIRAKAFTHKNDIFLGKGQSSHDTGLMAHELTHVVQQNKENIQCRAVFEKGINNVASCEEMSSWSLNSLIREYISLPSGSSQYEVNVAKLVKQRLRSVTSVTKLREYQYLILSEGYSGQLRGMELYDFINRLILLFTSREEKIHDVIDEYSQLKAGYDVEAAKCESSPKKDNLRRRLTWREELMLAVRPTRKWVLFHRGLIEELRIQYEGMTPSSDLEVIANRIHEQQVLLSWVLKQDIDAIRKRMNEILLLVGGHKGLVSVAVTPLLVSTSDEEQNDRVKLEYLKLVDELKEEEKELDLIARSFSTKRWESIRATYARFPRRPPSMWCMRALYKGIGAMFSPEESRNLEVGIYKESIAYGKRPGKKAGHYRTVDRMMINLEREGKTGGPLETKYDRKKKRYEPNLRDLVIGLVSRDQPGRYMFGVSLHNGYHSVALAVEVSISGKINIYWMDQYSRAGFARKTDVSSVEAMNKVVYARWLRPKYGYKKITVWPILQPEPIPGPESVGDNAMCTVDKYDVDTESRIE